MKVESLNKPKGFEPIILNITIESQEELDSLIARLSIRSIIVNKELGFTSTKELATPHACAMLLQKLELLKG